MNTLTKILHVEANQLKIKQGFMCLRKISIIKEKKEGWDVKKEGAKKASKNFDTKAEAEKYANEQGKKDKVEVIPHDKKGKFQKRGRNSYGNDPYPPKG